MEERVSAHYNEDYFIEFQSPQGEFGGWADISKFSSYINDTDRVLEFGCGGGYLLNMIDCKDKAGIEVNRTAREYAVETGLNVFADTNEVTDSWADVIISNHVLEHALRPLDEIIMLKNKLRTGGRMIFYVPAESVKQKYSPDDINHHLYTWNPMCLGNLFKQAGMIVESSEAYHHCWPPYYRQIAHVGGRKIFETACRVYGFLKKSRLSQVKIVARKT